MILSDIVEICKMRLKNISKSRDDEYIVRVVQLGISDLYNRFNLAVNSEVIATSTDMLLYEIRSPDVQMIITVYKPDGTECRQSDVLGSREWEWKQVNYRSFLLNNPKDGHVVAAYKASPRPIESLNSTVELPESFIEALILYVIYMTSATVQSQSSATGHAGRNEAMAARQMYEDECNRLIMMGYKINLQTERLPIQVKGFI